MRAADKENSDVSSDDANFLPHSVQQQTEELDAHLRVALTEDANRALGALKYHDIHWYLCTTLVVCCHFRCSMVMSAKRLYLLGEGNDGLWPVFFLKFCVVIMAFVNGYSRVLHGLMLASCRPEGLDFTPLSRCIGASCVGAGPSSPVAPEAGDDVHWRYVVHVLALLYGLNAYLIDLERYSERPHTIIICPDLIVGKEARCLCTVADSMVTPWLCLVQAGLGAGAGGQAQGAQRAGYDGSAVGDTGEHLPQYMWL